jgi:hypothetical protein
MGYFVSAILKQQKDARRATGINTMRLNDYLSAAATLETDIWSYWESHEQHLPGLAQMAKDILAVPISGVSVKRLFSTACQICSYMQNRLRPSTIRKMIVVKNAEIFILQREERGTMREIYEQVDGNKNSKNSADGDYEVAEKQVISNNVEKEEEEEDKGEKEDEEDNEVE